MKGLLAQNININGQPITGPLQGINTLGDLVNKIVSFIIPIGSIILLFVLISGGYDFMTSGGVSDKVKGAQGKITAGLIGFVLLLTSFLIVRLISYIFGFTGGIL